MTNTETNASMSGEERLKIRQKLIFKWVGLMFIGGVVTGLASGFIQSIIEQGVIPAWVMIPAIAISLAGMIWFSRLYFKKIDELDLADNLWASMIGFYFYIAALPVWWIIHDTGLAGPPNQWVIYAGTLAFSFAAYLARKLGLR